MKLETDLFRLPLAAAVLLFVVCSNVGDTSNAPAGQSADRPTILPVADQPAPAPGGSDRTSHGGTITFHNIGAVGWYPSRRDPAAGPCDATDESGCCRARHFLATDSLTPWNEELIMTLRGPMIVGQVAAYQPDGADPARWNRVSLWSDAAPAVMDGIAFKGNGAEKNGFRGTIGNTCLVDVSTNRVFTTGAGSVPYCPPSSDVKYYGWEGSKMMVVRATMPRVGAGVIDSAEHCKLDRTDNWYDAPWIGFSHGEMVRSGAFGSCHCYARDGAKWYLADGCGQFNAFEVVNDNNDYQNFDLFSTNFFGYGGYVGEGPCGKSCKVSGLDPAIDLVNKSTAAEAVAGAVASPAKGPGAAFRRPVAGYRYFVVLFDVETRTVQMAMMHPESVPPTVQPLLPALPANVSRTIVDAVLALRLPKGAAAGVLH